MDRAQIRYDIETIKTALADLAAAKPHQKLVRPAHPSLFGKRPATTGGIKKTASSGFRGVEIKEPPSKVAL